MWDPAIDAPAVTLGERIDYDRPARFTVDRTVPDECRRSLR